MGLVAMRGNGDVPHVVEMVDVGVVTDVGSHHARNPNPLSTSYAQSNLAFRDVRFEISVRKGRGIKSGEKVRQVILAPISGAFDAGHMIALIGPSGCGKTTLLDIIAGKKTAPYDGEVFLNGRPRDKLYRI